MRSLVDQFAALAEFPTARPKPADLNTIVEIRWHSSPAACRPPHCAPRWLQIFRSSWPTPRPSNAPSASHRQRRRGHAAESLPRAPHRNQPPRKRHGGTYHRRLRSGLTDEMRERLFLPYFSTKQRGTGLGLAIAAKIIQEHQGTIRAEKNEPAGAKFIVELRPASSLDGDIDIPPAFTGFAMPQNGPRLRTCKCADRRKSPLATTQKQRAISPPSSPRSKNESRTYRRRRS